MIAAETNEAAAQLYIDAAWREVASNPKPWKPASFLLRSDVTKTDQETWLRRFDQFVLPALRDAKCGIDLLSELIRFDIELMLNRTKQSSVHPARPYEKILPSVARNAFRLRPDVSSHGSKRIPTTRNYETSAFLKSPHTYRCPIAYRIPGIDCTSPGFVKPL